MAVIQWSQNTTHLGLPFALQTASGTPIDLTGVSASAITFKTRPALPRSTYTTLSGSVTLTSPASGMGFYQFAPADVAATGVFYLVVTVAYSPTSLWNSYEQSFLISQST